MSSRTVSCRLSAGGLDEPTAKLHVLRRILSTADRDLSASVAEPSVPVTDALVLHLFAFLANPTLIWRRPRSSSSRRSSSGQPGAGRSPELGAQEGQAAVSVRFGPRDAPI
jgi:hypothetical protein